MTLSQLECFCAVASHQSFAAAARQLYLTQPAVSKQIARLEQELGFSLLTRTTRSVSLTEKGRLFFSGAHEITELWNRTLKACGTASPAVPQVLRVGYFSNMSESVFPRYISPYGSQMPSLTVKPIKLLPGYASQIQSLSEKVVDLLFISEDQFPPDSGLHYVHLFPARCCGLMHRSHPLAGRKQLFPGDFNGRKVLVAPCLRKPVHSQKIEDALRASSPNAIFSGENMPLDEQLLLVLRGDYVALVPDYNCTRRPELVHIPFGPEFDFSFGLALPPKPSAEAEAFCRFAASVNSEALL